MAGDDEIVVTIEPGDEPIGGSEVVLVDETGITSGTTVKKASDDPVETLKSQLAEKQAALDSANQQISTASTTATQAIQRAQQAEREARENAERELAAARAAEAKRKADAEAAERKRLADEA